MTEEKTYRLLRNGQVVLRNVPASGRELALRMVMLEAAEKRQRIRRLGIVTEDDVFSWQEERNGE